MAATVPSATFVQTSRVYSWKEMLQLRDIWDRLIGHDVDRIVLGYDWFAQCWKAFSKSGRPEVLTFQQDGEVRGILPFRHSEQKGLRQLSFLDDWHSPRHDLIARPEDMEAMLWAAGEHLRDRRDWDIADLTRLSPMTTEKILEIWQRIGLRVRMRGSIRQRYLPLNRPWPEVEANFKPSLRKNLRRREARLRERGTVQVRMHTACHGLKRLLDQCFQIEASGWKGREGTAIRCQPVMERFYRQLAFRMARRNRLRIYGLWLQDELLAFQYCLTEGSRLGSLKVGYSEPHHLLSPGQVLRWHVMRRCCEEGFSRYDFLGQDQPSQAEWTPFTEERLNLRVYNRTLRGWALEQRSDLWNWWHGLRGGAEAPEAPAQPEEA